MEARSTARRCRSGSELVLGRVSHLVLTVGQSVGAIMDAMGEVTTINKLINQLREIEKTQEESIGSALKRLQDMQRRKILEQLDKIQ